MSQANIPNITPEININREDVINLMIASIALEELGLSHIINAEGEKIQYILGTLPSAPPPTATISEILQIKLNIITILNRFISNFPHRNIKVNKFDI